MESVGIGLILYRSGQGQTDVVGAGTAIFLVVLGIGAMADWQNAQPSDALGVVVGLAGVGLLLYWGHEAVNIGDFSLNVFHVSTSLFLVVLGISTVFGRQVFERVSDRVLNDVEANGSIQSPSGGQSATKNERSCPDQPSEGGDDAGGSDRKPKLRSDPSGGR